MKKLRKILLVDDDDVNNFINARLIDKLQITESIKITKNGKEALDFVTERCVPKDLICPELIILDSRMPVMDGSEFLKALNSLNLSNRSNIIIVALTANFRNEDMEKYKHLGVNEFSSKPLSEKLLLNLYETYWA